MAEEIGATVRDWVDVVRRARLGRTIKAVAVMLATYADSNGRRVFPGIARIAVECEISYNVAQGALSALRRAGLIERVSYGVRRAGKADTYRLVLATDLLERVSVLTPTEMRTEIDALTEQHGGGKHRKRETPEDPNEVLHPTGEGANGEVCNPPGGVQDDALHPTAQGAKEAEAESFAPHGVGSEPGFAPHGALLLHPTPLATTEPLHRHNTSTHHPDQDLPADVTHSRASPREEPQISVGLPERCTHGLPIRINADGRLSCALCRRATANALNHPSLALRLIQGGAAS